MILGVVHGASVQWVRCDAHAAVSGAYPRRGAQLALNGSDLSQDRGERFVTFITAALAVWNVGIAFVVGVTAYWLLSRKPLRL